MANARRVTASLKFNGQNVDTSLADYLKSVSYTDVASGSSDSISIKLQNITMKWLKGWYPTKGDKITADINFRDWEKEGKHQKISCGTFVLDDISFSGGPLEAAFGGLAIPANESFKSRERTKTWKEVTIRQIGEEIAGRYSLDLRYDADDIRIAALEQSEKTDSAFLYEVTKTYGLAMKVSRQEIIIYDKGRYEARKPITTVTREDFIDDGWTYNDTLEKTYTGARISYKSGKDNEEIDTYIGFVDENAPNSRVMKINEASDNLIDAKRKAAAKVNEANEGTTTLGGKIWPNPRIVAGVTVEIKEMGHADGKYFVDKVKIDVSDGGSSMDVEMHKCQNRLSGA